jgi:hypothetical protein
MLPLFVSQNHLSKWITEGSSASFSWRGKKISSWSRDVDIFIFTKLSVKRDIRGISFKLLMEREKRSSWSRDVAIFSTNMSVKQDIRRISCKLFM